MKIVYMGTPDFAVGTALRSLGRERDMRSRQ